MDDVGAVVEVDIGRLGELVVEGAGDQGAGDVPGDRVESNDTTNTAGSSVVK